MQSTIDEWSSIFLIGGLVYVGTAIIFIIFGSVEIQKWNTPKKKVDEHLFVTNVESGNTNNKLLSADIEKINK